LLVEELSLLYLNYFAEIKNHFESVERKISENRMLKTKFFQEQIFFGVLPRIHYLPVFFNYFSHDLILFGAELHLELR